MAALPIENPDPVPKRSWRRKNTHGKADARALTAAEVAERDLRAREHQDKRLRAATPECVLEEEEVQVPATPEQKPPASTAPARLVGEQGGAEGKGRSKRKRKVTEAYREARQAGLQSLGYSQIEE